MRKKTSVSDRIGSQWWLMLQPKAGELIHNEKEKEMEKEEMK
jgi:hypothetical protein